MQFTHTFDIPSFLDSLVSYLSAFFCGAVIGVERQIRQRSAGLRTYALVALGASAFVDLAQGLGGDVGATRVIAYVVSGVGFLGGGVIMKDGLNISGLNTAATLWCAAAVGACAGADMIAPAFGLTACILFANTILRVVARRLNKRFPLREGAGDLAHEGE